MKNDVFDRRTFLKGAVAGSAAAVIGALPQPVPAQQDAPAPAQQDAAAPAQQGAPAPAQSPTSAAYAYLNLAEQAFVEALVDHMVPADLLSPKGTDLGINIYIDRALAGGWGKGERLYMQGPWKVGVPSQGYQLPLTPAELYRAGIAAANAFCVKTYGKSFDKINREPARRISSGSPGRQGYVRKRTARARFLHHDVSDRHGRHVLRPDLRRQPEQGGLEDHRLPRSDRRALSERREVSRQEIHRGYAQHRGRELNRRMTWPPK